MGRRKARKESEWVKKHQIPKAEVFYEEPSGRVRSTGGLRTKHVDRNCGKIERSKGNFLDSGIRETGTK